MTNPEKFIMTQGDTDTLEWVVKDTNGAVDLSTATAVHLRYTVDGTTYDALATIVNPTAGICKYTLVAGDIARLVHGSYNVRSRVTFATGEQKHFPNVGYNTIEVEKVQ